MRDLLDVTADTAAPNDHIIIDDDSDGEQSGYSLRLSFVMLVTDKTLIMLKAGRTQVSILRQIADLYQLSSYDTVSVHKVPDETIQQVAADFVLVTIKDQFISRGDMLFFRKTLIGKYVYEGQRLHEPSWCWSQIVNG